MAALDAGCAGCALTTRPHQYVYALVNDAQAMKNFSRPRLFFLQSLVISVRETCIALLSYLAKMQLLHI